MTERRARIERTELVVVFDPEYDLVRLQRDASERLRGYLGEAIVMSPEEWAELVDQAPRLWDAAGPAPAAGAG